ncbi:hypothetical protein GQR91_00500 [Sphingomonas carotinifaciens]|uniref:Uncharacterized protein n=1 Tax=Sphingomonas carotinifaciens TaxID=1166323 RepID=A0A6N8LMH4_9SPHN|nr:hypothetical protein [Sphingomonas carotinifaciens]MWC42143.1 hypothetical protein [Sphingomonas carotinifaciens]
MPSLEILPIKLDRMADRAIPLGPAVSVGSATYVVDVMLTVDVAVPLSEPPTEMTDQVAAPDRPD